MYLPHRYGLCISLLFSFIGSLFQVYRCLYLYCRGHHARAVRSSKTTATTGVRVLLECRWVLLLLQQLLLLLLLLLSARVPVTTWPRRARVCLVRARCA